MPRNRPAAPIVPSEEDEQRTLAQWLDLHGVTWFHPANGGKRTRVEAAVFRALGVKPGVPDVIIVDRPPLRPEVPGVMIELKRRQGGKVSPHQRWWLDRLRELGWIAEVCEGADEAIRLLESLGYGRRRTA